MTLEVLLYVMGENPDSIVFHTITSDGNKQSSRCVGKYEHPFPEFMQKAEVKKYYFSEDIKQLEVML